MNGAANAADSEAEAVATVRHHGRRPLEPERYRRRRRLFADDFDNGPARPPGPKFVKQWHLSTAASFPNLRYEIDDEIVPDARGCVAFRWTATGRQDGAFGPITATGRTVTYEGAHFVRVESQRIVTPVVDNDTFGKIQQLGAALVPP